MNNCARPGQKAAIVANAIAAAIAENLTPTEENILGNLIVLIGSSLLAIAAIDETCETASKNATAQNEASQVR